MRNGLSRSIPRRCSIAYCSLSLVGLLSGSAIRAEHRQTNAPVFHQVGNPAWAVETTPEQIAGDRHFTQKQGNTQRATKQRDVEGHSLAGKTVANGEEAIALLSQVLDATATIASDNPKAILLSNIVTEVHTLASSLKRSPERSSESSSESSPNASPDISVSPTDLTRLLETALEQTQSMGDPNLAAQIVSQIGHTHAVLGNQQQAMTALDNAVAIISFSGIAEPTGDRVKALTAIASGYGALGKEPQAEAVLQEAKVTSDRLTEHGDQWPYAYALLDIAQAQIHMGQPQAATGTLLQVNQTFATEWVIMNDAIALVRQLDDEPQAALVLNTIIPNSHSLDIQVLDSIVTAIAEFEDQALTIELLESVISEDAQEQWSTLRMETPTVKTIATILMGLEDQQQALRVLKRFFPAAPSTTDDPLQSVYFINLDHVAAIAPVYGHLDHTQALTDQLLTVAEAWNAPHQQFQENDANPDGINNWSAFYFYNQRQIDVLGQVDAIARDHLNSQQYATVATAVMSGLDIALADRTAPLSAPATSPPTPFNQNWALNDLVAVYIQMEQWQQASELLGMMLAHLSDMEVNDIEETDKDLFLSGIVTAYGELGNEQVALEGLDRALAANTFGPLDRQLARLQAIALSYGQQGQFQQMDAVLNEITQQIPNLDKPWQLWVRLLTVYIHDYFDNHSEATALLNQARILYLSFKDVDPEMTPQYQWRILKELALAYNNQQDPQMAGAMLQEAIALTPALNLPKPDTEDEPWSYALLGAPKLLREILQTVEKLDDGPTRHDLRLAITAEASTLVDDMDKVQLLTHIMQTAISQDGPHHE